VKDEDEGRRYNLIRRVVHTPTSRECAKGLATRQLQGSRFESGEICPRFVFL
jgi:hypothetical protein